MDGQACVYMMASGRNGTIYIGCTTDLARRVWEHREGVVEGFADVDTTPWQMPASHIAVPDQKHPIIAIKHHGTDPERHTAGKPPIEVKKLPQGRLKVLSQGSQFHRHRILKLPYIAFDPCIVSSRLSLHLRNLQDIMG